MNLTPEELRQRDFLRALDPSRVDMLAHASEAVLALDMGKCPACDGPLERQHGGGDWYHFLEEDASTCTAREYGGRGPVDVESGE